jgi:NADH-quinone oxidoreductase chain G
MKSGISIIQACELVNIFIPRFCYHERLSIAGNCRMCLVEIEKMPKLQASCAVLISDNMFIRTNSPLVLKSREGVLEFLLINHPLDCPICDQGGECDLQDQSLFYGGDKNRFKEFKKAIEDKYCGPLIKTIMTRCIYCTRCIRFASEIIGIPNIGSTGRANSVEIGFYIQKLFISELSGNVIDLCPVGALTSKPYAFMYRSWELRSVESIDIFDSIHSNIRIDVKGYEIIRVLPRLNEYINDEWISDKARYAFDGLFYSRLTNPMLKDNLGVFNVITWAQALDIVYNRIASCRNCHSLSKEESRKIGLITGPFCDLESLVFLKRFSHLLNINLLSDNSDSWLNSDYQNLFKFNLSFNSISKSDFCLILGVNPKIDGVLLNYHLRKRYLKGKFNVAYFGSFLNLMFPNIHLGCSINKFISLLEGNNYFCKYLRKSKNPMIIIGKMFMSKIKNLSSNLFFNFLISNLNIIDRSWNVLNFFNLNSKDFCFYDLSINHNYDFIKNKLDLLFIVEEFKSLNVMSRSIFTIFFGHHGCLNAQESDLILPSTCFVEKNSHYANCEGRYQFCRSATLPLGYSKDSSIFFSNIIILLCELSVTPFPFEQNNNTFSYCLSFLLPSIEYSLNLVFHCSFINLPFLYSFVLLNNSYVCSSQTDNFYKTDIISQSSLNMSRCSTELLDKNPFKF